MHSYGGAYAPGALESFSKKERVAKGLPGGIIACVFTAAFVALRGTSAMQAMGFSEHNLLEWVAVDVCTLDYSRFSSPSETYNTYSVD